MRVSKFLMWLTICTLAGIPRDVDIFTSWKREQVQEYHRGIPELAKSLGNNNEGLGTQAPKVETMSPGGVGSRDTFNESDE